MPATITNLHTSATSDLRADLFEIVSDMEMTIQQRRAALVGVAAVRRPLAATSRPQLDQSLKAMAASGDVPALVGLFEAFLHAADAIQGCLNQPRLRDHDGAEELLTTENERFFDMAEAVMFELDQMQSVRCAWDRDLRSAALVRWDLERGAAPKEIVATLRKAAEVPTKMPN